VLVDEVQDEVDRGFGIRDEVDLGLLLDRHQLGQARRQLRLVTRAWLLDNSNSRYILYFEQCDMS
jgi:hypothetical protein